MTGERTDAEAAAALVAAAKDDLLDAIGPRRRSRPHWRDAIAALGAFADALANDDPADVRRARREAVAAARFAAGRASNRALMGRAADRLERALAEACGVAAGTQPAPTAPTEAPKAPGASSARGRIEAFLVRARRRAGWPATLRNRRGTQDGETLRLRFAGRRASAVNLLANGKTAWRRRDASHAAVNAAKDAAEAAGARRSVLDALIDTPPR